MTEKDVSRIVDAVAANKPSIKKQAVPLAILIAFGSIYSLFFQPQTLAIAASDTKIQVEDHTTLVHQALDKRLDRIETKIDKLIERSR